MSQSVPLYSIRLMFDDTLKNGVTPIGGAAWETEREQAGAWADLPRLSEQHSSCFFAELLDAEDDVLEVKPVSVQTCERVLGKPIKQLIADGRNKTAYTVEDFFKREPELRQCFPALSAAVPV